MNRRRFALSAAAAFAVSGCSVPGQRSGAVRIKTYDGPEVTSIVVNKGARKMYLLHGEEVLREYKVGLGFAPLGHKAAEGDGRTPEGTYRINRLNPNSQFHLSVGISYPNNADRAAARAAGKSPGGDIFIHGEPNRKKDRKRAARVQDWTAGCISVSNAEMEEIFSMVQTGTVITLRP